MSLGVSRIRTTGNVPVRVYLCLYHLLGLIPEPKEDLPTEQATASTSELRTLAQEAHSHRIIPPHRTNSPDHAPQADKHPTNNPATPRTVIIHQWPTDEQQHPVDQRIRRREGSEPRISDSRYLALDRALQDRERLAAVRASHCAASVLVMREGDEDSRVHTRAQRTIGILSFHENSSTSGEEVSSGVAERDLVSSASLLPWLCARDSPATVMAMLNTHSETCQL